MDPILHGLLTWLFAVALVKDASDRRLVVVAGVAMDIDGIFVLFDNDLYHQFHHTFGHSVLFGLLLAITAGALANSNRFKILSVAFGAFLVHIFADLIGSNWASQVFYPFSDYGLSSTSFLSNTLIYGVINPAVLILALIATVVVAYRKEFSPIEFISEKLDKRIVGHFVYPIKYKCELCGKFAFTYCTDCNKKICIGHTGSVVRLKCKNCFESGS